jgi:hypothetical protein
MDRLDLSQEPDAERLRLFAIRTPHRNGCLTPAKSQGSGHYLIQLKQVDSAQIGSISRV